MWWVVNAMPRPRYSPAKTRPSLYRMMSGRTDRKSRLHPDFFFTLNSFCSLCTFSLLVSLSWLSCILPFCLYLQHITQTSMPPAGYELAIWAPERSQTLSVDRPDTGIGILRTVQPVAGRYTGWAIPTDMYTRWNFVNGKSIQILCLDKYGVYMGRWSKWLSVLPCVRHYVVLGCGWLHVVKHRCWNSCRWVTVTSLSGVVVGVFKRNQ